MAARWSAADGSAKQQNTTCSMALSAFRIATTAPTAIFAALSAGKPYAPVDIAGKATVVSPFAAATSRLRR